MLENTEYNAASIIERYYKARINVTPLEAYAVGFYRTIQSEMKHAFTVTTHVQIEYNN